MREADLCLARDYDVTFHADRTDAAEAVERSASFVRDVERQLA